MKSNFKIYIFLFVVISLLLNHILLADKITFPLLSDDDLTNWSISQTDFYKEKELYQYINGGAEIFLEYGFKEVAVQQLYNSSREIKIEIYHMVDATAAYGIFSILKNDCKSIEKPSPFFCSTPYQLIAVKGSFYITFTNFTGDSIVQKESMKIAKKILQKITERDFSIPDEFRHPFFDSIRDNLKLVRGPLGIQNRFSTWIDLFRDINNYEVYILPVSEGEIWANVAKIKFSSGDDVQLFFNRLRLDSTQKNQDKWRMALAPDIWRAVRYRSNRDVLFLEVDQEYPNFQMLLKVMVPEEW